MDKETAVKKLDEYSNAILRECNNYVSACYEVLHSDLDTTKATKIIIKHVKELDKKLSKTLDEIK